MQTHSFVVCISKDKLFSLLIFSFEDELSISSYKGIKWLFSLHQNIDNVDGSFGSWDCK